MTILFKYFATFSGKALLLVMGKEKYLFNCFEGFQRCLLETDTKTSKMTTVFLPTARSVVPFLGVFSNMDDNSANNVSIITKHRNVLSYTGRFAHRPDKNLKYLDDFTDNNLEIKTFDEYGVTNALVQIKPLKGKFDCLKAQNENIPQFIWGKIQKPGTFKHDNKIYHSSDYILKETKFAKIAIIFNKDRYDNFAALEGVKVLFCFDQKIAKIITDRMDCQCFILDDARNVDYKSFYKMQSKLNKSYDSFGMPQKLVIPDRLELKSKCEFLNTCDIVDYSKGEGVYTIKQAEQLEFESNTILESVKDSIIFLGTGSALPSKYRNVTSILFRYNSKCIMLDCGEDTYYNICRYFGNDEICEDIETIFISHSHADHHLGAVKLISKILKRRESVNVICCKVVAEFIGMFIKSGVIYIDTAVRRYKTQFNEHLVNVDDYILRLDTTPKMSICSVPHTEDSVGIRIDYDNFSLAYSGDCRPSYLFTKMIEGVNVLINEATFPDKRVEEAHKTGHTTVAEAKKVAEDAKVGRLILTHLSQQTPDNIDSGDFVYAFDFLCYKIENFDSAKYQSCFTKQDETDDGAK